MKITKKIKIEDFFEGFASDIQKDPKKLREFEKAVNKVYSETGDADVILGALKVLACLKGNISKLAKDSKIERASVYNLFKKGSNPTFRNVAAVSHNLGVEFAISFRRAKIA
jgi:probable addiction module antidote protein